MDSESAKVFTPGRGKDVLFLLGVDFHCRVIFTYAYTHVEFTRVIKMRQSYRVLSLKVKLSKGSTFTFMCDLSYIASISFANVNFTHART